jgi:transcription termination/antitermination protein NusA
MRFLKRRFEQELLMSKEILLVVEAMANEKNVSRAVVFDALECALASAAKKSSGQEIGARVSINRNTGAYETFRRWEIVADDVRMENPEAQIRLMDAIDVKPDAEVGGFVEEFMENAELGRIGAQTAKQVILQRVREAERQLVVDRFIHRKGELITGTVKRIERGNVYVDMGDNAEAMIPKERTIPRESIRVGDRIRGFLYDVRVELRGPQLFVSRTAPEFMIELFRLEVPEVGQGLVEIKACARDPGDRAKMAVKAKDQRTDPIGACIGMRGARVQAVTNELNGERVDIVLWNDNPAQFVINAMAPAEVQSIIQDEENHSMDIAVAEEKLSQAIGRGGQNVRLASKLTGWALNVMTQAQAQTKSEAETTAARQMFVERLDIDEEIANILVQEGFSTIEEVAYVPASELLNVEEFDEGLVEELRARARDALLTQLIAQEEEVDGKPAQDLLDLPEMDEDLAYGLAAKGITSKEALADLATDELQELVELSDERAAALILAARA